MIFPSHIPAKKQQELSQIVEHIRHIAKKISKIEMIILFGSYARGDFVEKDLVQEWYATYEYKSDFDLLLITRKPIPEVNMRLSRNITTALSKDDTIHTPVSIIVEDIGHINARLEEGRYFYLDIKKEGIILYDSNKVALAETTIPSDQERKSMQQEDFTLWFDSSSSFFEWYKDFFKRKDHNGAAFMLHQVAEKAITAYMLVKTRYKPKTHDLSVLYTKLQELDTRFAQRFDLWEPTELEYFKLLQKAYVDARYSKSYTISPEQLMYLAEKVQTLRSHIHTIAYKEMN